MKISEMNGASDLFINCRCKLIKLIKFSRGFIPVKLKLAAFSNSTRSAFWNPWLLWGFCIATNKHQCWAWSKQNKNCSIGNHQITLFKKMITWWMTDFYDSNGTTTLIYFWDKKSFFRRLRIFPWPTQWKMTQLLNICINSHSALYFLICFY